MPKSKRISRYLDSMDSKNQPDQPNLYEEPIFHHTGSSTIPNLKLQDATATSLERMLCQIFFRNFKDQTFSS
jgi:hypothetical protein